GRACLPDTVDRGGARAVVLVAAAGAPASGEWSAPVRRPAPGGPSIHVAARAPGDRPGVAGSGPTWLVAGLLRAFGFGEIAAVHREQRLLLRPRQPRLGPDRRLDRAGPPGRSEARRVGQACSCGGMR